jgi:cytoskeleton protein RodZ
MFEIGSSLREARLRQELDFPEIEYATKIRGKYLRALEDEQFDVLPAQTYIKGFLRTYAEYLGLDGQLYVDEYNSRFISGEEETPLRTRSTPLPQQERRVQSRAVLAVVLGIALITALVIGAWKFGTSGGKQEKRHPARTVKHRRTTPVPTPAPVTSQSVKLSISATHGSGSYLEVRVGSASGRPLYSGTLQAGQSQVFRSTRIWLALGAPANVSVRVNGTRTALPGRGYPRVLVASRGGLSLAPAAG